MVKEHHILIILSVDAEESKETRSIRHATFLGLPSKSAVWQRTLSTNQRPENTYSKKAALEAKTCCQQVSIQPTIQSQNAEVLQDIQSSHDTTRQDTCLKYLHYSGYILANPAQPPPQPTRLDTRIGFMQVIRGRTVAWKRWRGPSLDASEPVVKR